MALLPLEKPPLFAIFCLPNLSEGTGFVLGQAFKPDIPNVGQESPTYSIGGAVALVTAR
jgi:hypothetical protein